MLISLTIENAALIEKVYIEFGKRLNILTGETGAGKSMIIDALNFILGRRAPKDFVRLGAESAYVSAVIECTDKNKTVLLTIFPHIDDDNLLVIERTLDQTGKSSCRINGKTVTIGVLKDIASVLFDIHSQHEHQNLLNPARHIALLDKFTSDTLSDELDALGSILTELNGLYTELEAIAGNSEQRESLIDLYSYQISEIEQADPKPGEDEKLNLRRRTINNSEQIAENASKAVRYIAGGGNAESALDMLITGQKALSKLSVLDSDTEPFVDILDDIIIRTEDLGRDLRAYNSGLQNDPHELRKIEERLDILYNLKRKYGKTIDDILVFYETTKIKLDMILNADAKRTQLIKKRDELRCKADVICAHITELRKSAAERVSSDIEKNLRELEMTDAVFSVSFEQKGDFTATGRDKIEFLLSANAGEPVRPLAQIASGGEISRVMLALKTVLSKADSISTYVFDEIDTGVSGRTAQKVANKLRELSNELQLLCITHLPQIAAFADTHILVEKNLKNGKTVTNAYNLDENGTQKELARLIGGAVITEQTQKAAAELREMAK